MQTNARARIFQGRSNERGTLFFEADMWRSQFFEVWPVKFFFFFFDGLRTILLICCIYPSYFFVFFSAIFVIILQLKL